MWAGAGGKKHKERRKKGLNAFSDCLELHKLMGFSTDAAERQQYYIQQGIWKPVRATARQFVTHVEVLSDTSLC